MQQLKIKPWRRSLGPWCQKKMINSKNRNLEKHSITSRSYAKTYNQTLEEVKWLWRLDKPKNDKKLQKI